jgi:hypothetical protein
MSHDWTGEWNWLKERAYNQLCEELLGNTPGEVDYNDWIISDWILSDPVGLSQSLYGDDVDAGIRYVRLKASEVTGPQRLVQSLG